MEHPATHIPLSHHIRVNDEIELRVLEAAEAPTLYSIVEAHRDHLRTWLPWVDANREIADSLRFIEGTREQLLQKTALTLAIIVRRAIAGIITLRSLDWTNRSAEIGYWLAKDFQGQGIMLQCCRSLIRHAFVDLKLHRIVIRCAPGNTRSCAIPERLGFVREGVSREAEWLNGTYVDLNMYSLLCTDWKDK